MGVVRSFTEVVVMRSIGGVRVSGGVWSLGVLVALIAASTVTVVAPADRVAAASEYVALSSPARLVDTRPGAVTFDGNDAGTGLRPADSTMVVQVTDRAGIPVDASSVVLNVTAVAPLDAGYVTVHPTGTPRPNASNVNYHPARTIANAVIARVGTGGMVSIYTLAATHLVVDIAGHLPTSTYTALSSPARLVDTRPGAVTFDGNDAGTGLRPAGSTMVVQVADRAGVPADASSVVLNVTAVDPQAPGFITVHPAGTPLPNASNVNYYPAHTTANTVIARVGTGGSVSVYTLAPTHLVIDIAGHLPTGSYNALPNTARLVDTRTDYRTIDGQHSVPQDVPAGHSMQLNVAGSAGVPTDASAAVLTVTATHSIHDGFSTVHPTGTDRPNASSVNYYRFHDTANTVIARLGAGGEVCIYASATTDFVVDVSGYFTGPPPPNAGPACPEAPLDDEPCTHLCPPPGTVRAVVGVPFDEGLPLRAAPAPDQPVIATLPSVTDVVTTGDNRRGWLEVTAHGVTGWADRGHLLGLNGTFDITAQVLTELGGTPRAPMLNLGRIVADTRVATFDNITSAVTAVVAPTDGPIGEVTYDVIGFPDDSVGGVRLRVSGRHVGGLLYDLMSVEATGICWRGGGGTGYGGLCV